MLAQALKVPEQLGALRTGAWLYERKLDGLRCLAVRHGRTVELWSRNHLSFNHRFPDLVTTIAGIAAPDFTLDGEIVAFSGERSSFALLHRPGPDVHAVYCPFDVVHLLERDTSLLPLTERIALLERLLEGAPAGIRLPERVTGDPSSLLDAACERGWEGLMAKLATSTYRPGRSPDWRKLKCTARQEFVIGGWTEPSGARTGFGAIVVGFYDSTGLRYAGKVGTGFDERDLRTLGAQMATLEQPGTPFADPVNLKGVHWVRPQIVAEVAFTEWTLDGRLRHPSFLGLRPDKTAAEVTRELG